MPGPESSGVDLSEVEDENEGVESPAMLESENTESAKRRSNSQQQVVLYPRRRRKHGANETIDTAEEDDDIEEIPRTTFPSSTEPITNNGNGTVSRHSVTFSGSYRIPLPASISDRDVRAVQRGLSGVQSIAKKVLAEARATRSSSSSTYRASTRSRGDSQEARSQSQSHKQQQQRSSSSPANATTAKGSETGGWSEWIGGYTMSVARMVSAVQLQTDLPKQSVRWSSAEPTPPTTQAQGQPQRGKRRPPKLARRGSVKTTAAGKKDGVEGLYA